MKDHATDGSATDTEVWRSITIGRSAEDVYRCWRDPHYLSEVTTDVFRMTPTGSDQGHWEMSGALGTGLEWDARVVEDVPGKTVAWQSTDASTLRNELRLALTPAPADQGTEAHLSFRFHPPGGVVGETVTKVFGTAPETLVGKILRRFKARLETGEMPTLAFNTSARKEAGQPGEQK